MKSTILTLAGATLFAVAATANANSISDPGFESTSSQPQQLTWTAVDIGSWGVGDAFFTTGTSGSISPFEGSKMLEFNGGGTYGDVYQIIDLTSYAAAIDAGNVSVDFSAYFNSVTPNDVGLHVIGWDAAPTGFTGITFSSGNATTALKTDADASTWQQALDSADIPVGLRFIALGIHGKDGVQTFVDSASLTIVPLPAAAWLFGSALLGLVTVARRRTVV